MLKTKLTGHATQVRVLRFIVSGLSVMMVQLGTLSLFAGWWTETTAFIASYAVAVGIHYTLNRFWALRSRRTDQHKQAAEYFLTVAASFLINFCLYQAGVRFFHLKPVWAALVTNPPTTVLVFLVLNFRVFRA